MIASWSKDPSTKCGAVIVDKNRRIISTGYNGFPQGIVDYQARLTNRDIKLRLTIHAEQNAILFAKQELKNCTIYVTGHPCAHCAASIIQSGIRTVITAKQPDLEKRWAEDMKLAKEIFTEAGVELIQYDIEL